MKLTVRAARQFASAFVLVLALVGCKPTAELEACNIAHSECQLDIYYALLRLRGDGADPFGGVPPIRTLTVEEYEAELRRSQPPPKKPEEKKEEEEEKPEPIKPWDAALQLLGLIAPKVPSAEQGVTDRVNRVAAFYSSGTREVTVIDRGGEHDDRGDTVLLTHELVHALQDDELSGFDDGSIDVDLARRAMIEGEATLYENLTAAALDGKEDVDWHEVYAKSLARRRRDMPGAKSPYYSTNWFVYPLGAGRLVDAYEKGGNAAVRHVLGDPPRSSAALMLFSDGAGAPSRAGLKCTLEPPGAGFELAGYDQLGALMVYGFLAHNGVEEAEAWERASRITDDRLWIYFDKDAQEVAVTWRQRFGDPDDADALAALVTSDTFIAEADGGDLVVRASNVDDLLGDWAGAADCNR